MRRHTVHGATKPTIWIEAIFVDNNNEILSHTNILPHFHSRHNLIDVKNSLFIPRRPLNTFTYRKFKNMNPEDINDTGEIRLDCF